MAATAESILDKFREHDRRFEIPEKAKNLIKTKQELFEKGEKEELKKMKKGNHKISQGRPEAISAPKL